MEWAAALLLSLSVSLLATVLVQRFGPGGPLSSRSLIRQRLAEVDLTGMAPTSILKKKENLSEVETVKRLLSHFKPSVEIALLLRSAKLKVSVSVFMLASILFGLGLLLVLRPHLGTFASAAVALFGIASPLLYLRMLRKKYLNAFAEYLPNALGIISSSIKVGHGIESALDAVAKTAPYPVCEEFRVVLAEVKLGLSLTDALNNLYGRIQSQELKIFVTGIAVHQDLGGSLSEILDNLEETIRDRFALLREIDTLSAQGRLSSWILFLIPFVLMALYMWKSQAVFLGFVQSPYGRIVIWTCLLLQIAGFLGIRQVVRLRD